MFTAAELKKHFRQQPFRPLRVHTTAGAAYDVRHPELVMIGVRELQIGLPSRQDPAVYDDWVCVPLLHVSSIEQISAPGASA